MFLTAKPCQPPQFILGVLICLLIEGSSPARAPASTFPRLPLRATVGGMRELFGLGQAIAISQGDLVGMERHFSGKLSLNRLHSPQTLDGRFRQLLNLGNL